MESDKQNESTSLPENNTEHYIDEVLNNFKNKVNLSSNTKIKVINKSEEPNGGLRINISYVGEYPIKPPELNQEVLVSTPLTAELQLDKKRKLVKYQILDPGSNIIDPLKEELNSMLKRKQVQIIEPNEKVSSAELFANEKEFYIQKDEQGKQHLRRSYFSSE